MGLSVQFTNASTGDIAYNIWDFGDGGFSLDTNPLYTYALGGTYNVTLTVIGVYGSFSRVTHPVAVTSRWSILFDFTLNDGGFINNNPLFGSYSPGVGWITGSPGGTKQVGIHLDFPTPAQVDKMTMTFHNPLATATPVLPATEATYNGVFVNDFHTWYQVNNHTFAGSPPEAQPTVYVSTFDDTVVDGIVCALSSGSFTTPILSLLVEGDGAPP